MGRGSIEGTGMYAMVALAWVGEHGDRSEVARTCNKLDAMSQDYTVVVGDGERKMMMIRILSINAKETHLLTERYLLYPQHQADFVREGTGCIII
jgi:hypothetical protein